MVRLLLGLVLLGLGLLACGIREACGLFFLGWACHFGISCFYRCGSTAVSYGGGVGISCFYRVGSTADSVVGFEWELWLELQFGIRIVVVLIAAGGSTVVGFE